MAVVGFGLAASSLLAGSVASGAITATVATAITATAAAVGSYIDNTFILPAIFPPENVEGPRLGELRVQFAEEGAPINTSLGSGVRTNGVVVWTSDLIEVERSSGGGGKGGGGGGKVTTYEYYLDMALVVAKTDGTAINGISEITGNGKPIYREQTNISFTGSVSFSASLYISTGETGQDITTSSLDLGNFFPGDEVVITGASNPNNNGTFVVLASSSDASGPSSTLRVRNENGVAEGPTAGVSFDQDVSDFSSELVEDVEIRGGTYSQAALSTIVDIEGAGNVPAWRGYVLVGLKRLFLGEYGNLPPQFNFIYNPGTTATSGGMISSFISLSEAPTEFQTDLDVSGATEAVRGISIQGETEVVKAIQPIMVVGDLLAQTSGAGLKFFGRRDATVIDVDPEDLSPSTPNSDPTETALRITDNSEISRPDSVTVKYLDHEARYQQGAQRETSRVLGTTGSNLLVNLPVVLEGAGAEARGITRRLLYEGYINRKEVDFSLPFKYLHVQENDLLRIPAYGHIWTLLVQRVDRSPEFLLRISARVEVRSSLQVEEAESPSGTEIDFTSGSPPQAAVIDDPGYGSNPYPAPGPGPGPGGPGGPPTIGITTSVIDPDSGFPGAVIYKKRKDDDDADYEEFGILGVEAYNGKTEDALGGGVSGLSIDRKNSIDVELYHGALASLADTSELLRGRLILKIGNEIVFAENATLIGEKTYTVDTLIRGIAGTEGEIENHVAGESIVVLTGPGIREGVFPILHTEIGKELVFKIVAPEQELADVPEIEFTPVKVGLQPFAPVQLSSNRSTTEAILRWERRSRTPSKAFGPGSTPLTEPTEKYEVEIWDSGDTNLLATIEVDGTNVLTVSQTDLTTYGVSVATAFNFRVYQINTAYGGDGRSPTGDVLSVNAAGS